MNVEFNSFDANRSANRPTILGLFTAGPLYSGRLASTWTLLPDLLDGAEGLTLTEGEHEVGWGKAECTLCHQLENIHLENRTGLPIDIDQIHDDAIEDGVDGCPDCHGANGVP